MRNTYAESIEKELAFAKEAAKHFAVHHNHWSYSKGSPDQG